MTIPARHAFAESDKPYLCGICGWTRGSVVHSIRGSNMSAAYAARTRKMVRCQCAGCTCDKWVSARRNPIVCDYCQADIHKGDTMTARLQIRAKTYRGQEGFTISGTDGLGRTGQRVFARTRAEAERIRDAMKAGEEWTFDSLKETPTMTDPKCTCGLRPEGKHWYNCPLNTEPQQPLTVTEDSYGWKYEGGTEPPTDFQCACGHPMSAHAEPTGEREPHGECSALDMDELDQHRPTPVGRYGETIAECDEPTCMVGKYEWWEGHAAIIRAAVCDCREGWPVESDEPDDEPRTKHPALNDREPWAGGIVANE